jgi:hypothetical protein
VPPLVTGKVPVTPVVSGKPVALVSVPEAGVPSAGVVSVGEVSVLLVSVSVPASVTKVPEVGRVSAVIPETVNVVPCAPVIVSVLAALLATPVPPFAADTTPVRLEMALDAIFIKSEPFQATMAFSPETKVTPVVGPDPTILTDCDVEVLLITMYALLDAGAVIVRRLAGLPVQLIMAY